MRVLIFIFLLVTTSAQAKNLTIIGDGVVENIITIKDDWTEAEWAPFVPEGKIAVLSETAHITDRYIDGKFMRQFNMPREDGWRQLIFADVDNPPEPVRVLIAKPWTLAPSYTPPPDEQIATLKAQVELLEADIKARVEQLESKTR
jgi:hypothetical protein